MGCWDELCLLCGVSGSGPRDIAHRDIATEAKTIADEICPGNVELVQILEQALRVSEEGEQGELRDDRKPWLVNGLGYNGYAEDYIAIGCFDDENIGFAPMREGKAPRGEHVEVRRVDGISSGSFTQVVVERDGRQVKENRDTNCSATDSAGMPNIWLDTRCYHYLESWVDWQSVPAPSKHHISSRPPLSFASELYEMIYSRKRQRDSSSGLPPEIDYQGIEASLEQWQDFFMPCRRGSKHVAQAIEAGLRGADLIPAILRDCRAWMFMRPDIWPTPPATTLSFISRMQVLLESDSVAPRLATLPNELLLAILRELPLQSFLALSATCRALHAMLTEPSFCDRVLLEAIVCGGLRWILPVDALPAEKRAAHNVMRLWLPEEHRPEAVPEPPVYNDNPYVSNFEEDSGEDDESKDRNDVDKSLPPSDPPSVLTIVTSPHFDRIAFVRACWQSDSMMNRRRLWGQAKQFEVLWTGYRRQGWQIDRFYDPDQPAVGV
ncbi:F-box protein [Phanerochaete sordida]|uniref:F-box protein n=1 Tax=Phanerochaete sordida TaxID=48140 RepID=A0A9P3G6Q5_9APHY|nr:F-box protein [Phanerochaete sordida]